MTTVNINSVGHQVIVEHDGPIDEVIAKARDLFEATRHHASEQRPGAAMGFVASQTKLHTNWTQYGPASFGHGDRPVVDA